MPSWNSISTSNSAHVEGSNSIGVPLATVNPFSRMLLWIAYTGSTVLTPDNNTVTWTLLTSVYDTFTNDTLAVYTAKSIPIIQATDNKSVTIALDPASNALAFIDVLDFTDPNTIIEAYASNIVGTSAPTTQNSGTATVLMNNALVLACGFCFATNKLTAGSGFTQTVRPGTVSTSSMMGEVSNTLNSAGDIVTPTVGNGWTNGGVFLTVVARNCPSPTASMTSYQSSCPGGTLTYSSTNAETLTIDNGIGAVTIPSGTESVSPTTDTTYTLTASNAAGYGATAAIAQATVLAVHKVAPNVVTGAVSNFDGFGGNYAAGKYRIKYDSGSYRYSADHGHTVNGNQDIVPNPHGRTAGFWITDSVSNLVMAPGNTTLYVSQAAAEAGNAGLYVDYQHIGGTIGIYLNDFPYYDNIADTPGPTFAITPLVPIANITATPSTIVVGQSSTLSYSSQNATSATLNSVGVATTGTQSVSPTTTTSYTFVATDGCLSPSAVATVTVTPNAAPGGLVAVGGCSSAINLSWISSPYAAGYKVERSADGLTSWSQIGTPSGTTFADTAPIPGTTYYYRVKASTSGVDSGYSNIANAYSLLPAPTPTGVSMVPHGGRYILYWTAPVGSYGSVTVSIFEGLTSGGESGTPIVTGINASLGYYSVTGRNNGQPYFAYIEFVNSCSTSAASSEVTGIPYCCANDFTQEGSPSNGFTQESTAGTTFSITGPTIAAFTALSNLSPGFTQEGSPSSAGLTGSNCPDS